MPGGEADVRGDRSELVAAGIMDQPPATKEVASDVAQASFGITGITGITGVTGVNGKVAGGPAPLWRSPKTTKVRPPSPSPASEGLQFPHAFPARFPPGLEGLPKRNFVFQCFN